MSAEKVKIRKKLLLCCYFKNCKFIFFDLKIYYLINEKFKSVKYLTFFMKSVDVKNNRFKAVVLDVIYKDNIFSRVLVR